MKHVLVVQHVAVETLGAIESSLTAANLAHRYVRPYLGEPVPTTLGDACGLIVLGGPMGVYEQDQFPYLLDEMRLIESALAANRPVLGICLGSQLLAHTLGARVFPGQRKEIGWYRVTMTADASRDAVWSGAPSYFVACHWHGDVFDLPEGAVLLASSDLTPHQAFRYSENAYGTLFHLETTEAVLQQMVTTFADELSAAGISGERILADASQHFPSLRTIGGHVFDRWSRLVTSAGKEA